MSNDPAQSWQHGCPNWQRTDAGLYKAWYDGCVVVLIYTPVYMEEGRQWPQLVNAWVKVEGATKAKTRMLNGYTNSVFDWADEEVVRLREADQLCTPLDWQPRPGKEWEPTDGAAQCTYRDRHAELEWQHPITEDGTLDKTVRWLTLFYDGACYDSQIVATRDGVYCWAEQKLRLMQHPQLTDENGDLRVDTYNA